MAGNGKLPLHARFLALHVISPIRKARECVSEKHTYFYIVYSFFVFILFILFKIFFVSQSSQYGSRPTTQLRSEYTHGSAALFGTSANALVRSNLQARIACAVSGTTSKIVSCQTPSFSTTCPRATWPLSAPRAHLVDDGAVARGGRADAVRLARHSCPDRRRAHSTRAHRQHEALAHTTHRQGQHVPHTRA